MQPSKFPDGSFSSPIPNVTDIIIRSPKIFKPQQCMIPRDKEKEAALINRISRFYSDAPWGDNKAAGLRYYYDNPVFSYGDALSLFMMLREFTPRRVIEVGCGFSSCVAMDTNQRFFNNEMELWYIEPDPERLNKLRLPTDNIKLNTEIVQNVPLEFFDKLEANDLLFIDSSHVSKCGSDVNFIIFEVLPRLRSGVIIHFHDIFNNFDYPMAWIMEGRFWTESYLLRAFLSYNPEFQILLFNSDLDLDSPAMQEMPMYRKNKGGSIYIRKL